MRLILLTALTMVAFAANSILNRMAVDGGHADPGGFAVLRVAAGALVLSALVLRRGGGLNLRQGAAGPLSLAAYMIGFSLGYVTLDAGPGALILFGVVQLTIFGLTAIGGTAPTWRQVMGAAIAFAGLALILVPDEASPVPPAGAAFMIVAGIGWGVYTLAGRSATDPLQATAANFVLALPLTLVAAWLWPGGLGLSPVGAILAVLSGAVTSGLGYALWYSLVPRMAAATSATVLLSVPVIAILAGVALLGESLGLRFIAGTILVLGGIAFPLWRQVR